MKDMLGNEAKNLPGPEEEEIWVELSEIGYPRNYASSFGRLKGVRGEVLHPRQDKNGYEYCYLYTKADGKSVRHCVKVHRIICMAFWGMPPKDKPLTDHKDRCRINNYYKNLQWASHLENKLNSKTYKKGKNHQPITLYSNKTNEPLMNFKNLQEASEMLGISYSQIQSNLTGQRAPFQIGYFKYDTKN